ncbi:hypothetical protein GF327_07235 [Candidatus Woesearchaeota archaeon]|nr:hypothetical protein [Candidatus Woesearchaeota archaeon]
MKFCPNCGKDVIKGTFCKECRPPPEIRIKDIKIKLCSDCRSYFYKNQWEKYSDLKNSIKRYVHNKLEHKLNDFEIEVILPKINKKPGKETEFEIKVNKNEVYFLLPAKLIFTRCERCTRRKFGYSEGMLQLRNPRKEIIDFIQSKVKKNRDFSIVEKNPVKAGLNIKFNSKKLLFKLGQELEKRFGGTLKTSSSLTGLNTETSKKFYTLSVYYEPYKFSKGDVIKTDKKLIQVTKPGKQVYGKDLILDRSVSIDLKNKDYEIKKKYKTRVSKVHPEIEVLDPETYQSVEVENKADVKPGEKVKVVLDKGRMYLLD